MKNVVELKNKSLCLNKCSVCGEFLSNPSGFQISRALCLLVASLLLKAKAATQNFTARTPVTGLGGCSVPQPDINSTLAKYARKVTIIPCEGDKDVQFLNIAVRSEDQ